MSEISDDLGLMISSTCIDESLKSNYGILVLYDNILAMISNEVTFSGMGNWFECESFNANK